MDPIWKTILFQKWFDSPITLCLGVYGITDNESDIIFFPKVQNEASIYIKW